jgi:two-component system, OmpR family, copper resistance phosphate regulon response regulator CusR
MRILIAEDDSALASFVKKGLDAEHYAVDVTNDGEQARAMAGEFDYDLVVLDLNLPRLDGVSILRYLRTRKPSMPIMVLTGRTRVEDRVQCLDLGADDYLGKPFSFSELSARIRALLRRCHMPAESVLTVDDLKLDRVERRVERAGRRIDLTGKEFALLEYLMRNAGRRITRAMIIEHVWNLSFDTCTNVVDVYVNYSTAQVDKKKVNRLATAIQVAFQQLGAYPTADLSGEVPADESVEVHQVVPIVAIPHNDENHDLTELRKELEQALAPEISRGEVEVRSGHDGLVISLREAGFFDSGSAGVKVGPAGLQSHGCSAGRAAIQPPHRRSHRQRAHPQYAIYLKLGTLYRSLDRDDSPSDHEIRLCPAAAVRRRLRRISSHRQQ